MRYLPKVLEAFSNGAAAIYEAPSVAARQHAFAEATRLVCATLETSAIQGNLAPELVCRDDDCQFVLRLLESHLYAASATPCTALVRASPDRPKSLTPNDPSSGNVEAAAFTRRELEVLIWIREGKRDAEIAAILGISPRTVGKHVENLLRKTGTKTRLGAVNAVTMGKTPPCAVECT